MKLEARQCIFQILLSGNLRLVALRVNLCCNALAIPVVQYNEPRDERTHKVLGDCSTIQYVELRAKLIIFGNLIRNYWSVGKRIINNNIGWNSNSLHLYFYGKYLFVTVVQLISNLPSVIFMVSPDPKRCANFPENMPDVMWLTVSNLVMVVEPELSNDENQSYCFVRGLVNSP